MKKTDLQDLPDEIIELLQSLFELTRQARRRTMEIDIKAGATNRMLYKYVIQIQNEILARLTYEK